MDRRRRAYPPATSGGVGDVRSIADRVDAVARENAAATQHATTLPVRQPEFGLVECVLAVDPPGETVAHERRVDRRVEALVLGGVGADQRGHEVGAVAIEELDAIAEFVDDHERDLGAVLPFPLHRERRFRNLRSHRLVDGTSGAVDAHDRVEELARHELVAPLHHVEAGAGRAGVGRAPQRVERDGHQPIRCIAQDHETVEGVADLAIQ